MTNELFKARLKSLRKHNKKRQQDISNMLHINRSTYGAYETGVITPPMDKIKALADYFDVSVDYLIGTDSTPDEHKINDITDNLNALLELMNSDDDLYYDGKILSKDTRDDMKSAFETFLKYMKMIDTMNKREQ